MQIPFPVLSSPLSAYGSLGFSTLLPYLRIVVPALLVLVVGMGTMLAWRRWEQARRPRLWALGATAAFCVLDWGMITALRPLELSFGPEEAALLFLWSVRASLLFPFLVPSFRHRQSPPRARGLIAHWAFHLLLLAGTVDAFYLEPFAVGTTHLALPAPGLTRPLRIVQLSDTHVEYTSPRERALVPLVNALQPDLIVLTGDYLNLATRDDPRSQRDARDLLSQLHAPYGVYAIAGTVDYPPEAMQDLFEGLDIAVLHDQVVHLPEEQGDLYIVGITNWERGRDEPALLRQAMAQTPPESYTLLLYHTPDLIEVAAETGVDLYLAGHTHGGQVRLPFYGAIVTFSAYGKRFEMGQYAVGPTTLYVSRGLGMEGFWITPRVRFLCPPEVVVVDLEPVGPATR
jgi:predicted MPP superfamily phosphohydrolase